MSQLSATTKPICILHAGMPKTGTSAVQQYLHATRNKPSDFLYICFRSRDSGYIIAHVFFSNLIHRYRGYWSGYLQVSEAGEHRRQASEYLQRQLTIAREKNKSLLFSWEVLWDVSAEELRNMKHYLEAEGFEVRILAYLRPWKAWVESMFQQKIKTGDYIGFPMPQMPPDYRAIIQKLDEVFGRENVWLANYDLAALKNGCMVQDFCARIGLPFDADKKTRVNESLRLPAVQLLYAYNRFGKGMANATGAQIQEFIRKLNELEGNPVRFHPDLTLPLANEFEKQRTWLEKRTMFGWGFEKKEAWDSAVWSIRKEADLFEYEDGTLAWLAQAVHSKQIAAGRGVWRARRVARQMQVLFEQVTTNTAHYNPPAFYRIHNLFFYLKKNITKKITAIKHLCK